MTGKLPPLDVGIVVAYIAATLFLGFWFSSRAGKNLRAYFLGGNRLPWYALGLSNASGMFDVAGTMWLVAILFVYGLKSIWLPWLWPVFNQIFLMAFLSVWLRRSGVMTGGEWITFRFGDGNSARLSHCIIVIFALILVLAYMAYSFLGIGKLAAEFMPMDLAQTLHLDALLPPALRVDGLTGAALETRNALMASYNDRAWGVLIIFLTTISVIRGGMFSVVFTEAMQFLVMTAACVAIAAIAMSHTTPAMIAAATPHGWANPFFGWKLDLDWSAHLPAVNQKIAHEGYSLFTLFFTLVLLKGVLNSLAGPAPNYDMQRILSARSPSEAAKMSAFVNVVLNPPRYLMISGLTVLALVYFSPTLRQMGTSADFEAILPFTLVKFIPTGILGLTLAGLIAAFMSSFAAPLNAAPAYIVNDLYRKYVNPHASERTYIWMSYTVSALFVIVGTAIGLTLTTIDGVVNWITSGLYGGYTAANVVKWYWWRMNGYGYFWGMFAGIAFALLLSVPQLHLNALEAFPAFFALCLAAVVIGSLATAPTDMATLKRFYLKTRPWGFWGAVRAELKAEGREVAPNKSFGRDMFNVVVGVFWQTCLVAAPIFFVTRAWTPFAVCLGIIAVTSLVLKFTWYDYLRDYPDDLRPEERGDFDSVAASKTS